MAEEQKHTKIPRFDSGTSATTRIPKPGFVRPSAPAIGISKLIRPQSNRFGLKAKTETNSPTEEIQSTPQTALPRKSFLCRFSAANKVAINGLPRIINKNPLKPSQLASNETFSQNNGVAMNETVELSRGAMMNATKPVIDGKNGDATMDRSLTRSNTFVCDGVDDQQVKLLSITHNVNTPPSDIVNQEKLQLGKERTSKRSLSPIPGDLLNAAKRKHVSQIADRKVMSGPILNSTPRRSLLIADATSNFSFFTSKSAESIESQMDHLQKLTFDSVLFEHNASPDAAKLSSVTNSSMHNNRMFDLTQTVEQNDTFYPENRNATRTLDANPMEYDAKNRDASKPNAPNTNKHDADADLTKTIIAEKTQPIQIVGSGALSEDALMAKKRFSLGLELPECTLDCSIELCDLSAATSVHDSSPLVNYNPHSYDMDESLGILTPDQMIEFLDTNASHAKLELPSSLPVKIGSLKCRVDQTPSPEDLPLDTIEIKTFDTSKLNETELETTLVMETSQICEPDRSQADSYTKTDQMTKSATSKAANSFITSVTSIASLDNGYHADGEMSRPASRGAESPMRRVHNARQNKLHSNDASVPVVRRQDPMTDSDFFTESDADDIFHRGAVAPTTVLPRGPGNTMTKFVEAEQHQNSTIQ